MFPGGHDFVRLIDHGAEFHYGALYDDALYDDAVYDDAVSTYEWCGGWVAEPAGHLDWPVRQSDSGRSSIRLRAEVRAGSKCKSPSIAS